MTKYEVDLSTSHQAERLTNFIDNHAEGAAFRNGRTVTFNDAGLTFLADQTASDDDFYITGSTLLTLWASGDAYPVRKVD